MGKKVLCIFILLVLACWCIRLSAQNTADGRQGEVLSYDVYFKWGMLMPRAGDAVFSYSPTTAVKNGSTRYRLLFKTAKFFDGFFKMRDTLSCYYNGNDELIFSKKNSDEGDYYLIDELTFNYAGEGTKIKSRRYTPTKVKIDTTLLAKGDVTDLLGAIHYLRKLDRDALKSGDTFPLTIAIGRDLVKMQFRYQHQAVIERGKAKFNTLYFVLDIFDEAFESTKAAAELWVGDDDNLIPVKVRSKLKIGYAEVYYKSSSNLKYPLKCRIELK